MSGDGSKDKEIIVKNRIDSVPLDTVLDVARFGVGTNDKSGFFAAIELALKTLTFREREMLKLHAGLGDGYRYRKSEIARIFKVSAQTVTSTLSRAKRKLMHPIRYRLLEPFLLPKFSDNTRLILPDSSPTILLQSAVITTGNKCDEGQI